jgi:hypothetical protein
MLQKVYGEERVFLNDGRGFPKERMEVSWAANQRREGGNSGAEWSESYCQIDCRRETVWMILPENLGMKKVRANMVPKNLTTDQLQ